MKEDVYLRRQVTRRAERWRPPPGGPQVQPMRQYPLRPATFVLQTGPADPWDTLPRRVQGSAPMERAYYEAEVDEVDRRGRLHLTLWEYPSGRAFYASLPSPPQAERRGPEPAPGDRLQIWTWVELPGGGEARNCRFMWVHRRRLGPRQREALERLAAAVEPKL